MEAPGKTMVYTYDGAGNFISQDETYTLEQVIPAIDGTGIGEIKYIVKRSEYVYSNINWLSPSHREHMGNRNNGHKY